MHWKGFGNLGKPFHVPHPPPALQKHALLSGGKPARDCKSSVFKELADERMDGGESRHVQKCLRRKTQSLEKARVSR